MEMEEAEGSIVRSRAQWHESGEKSTAYFFNLEKQNFTKKSICKLMVDNKEVTDQTKILNEIQAFYKKNYIRQYQLI